MNYKLKDIIERIKQEDEKLIKSIYQEHRDKFIHFICNNYFADEDDAKDAYQKSFASFYFNVLNDKIKNLEIKIETYIFAIGKNVIKNAKRGEVLKISTEEISHEMADDYDIYENEKKSHDQQKVQILLEKIGEPCKTILHQFFFLNFSLESIANRHGYKNAKVAKKKKFLCMQKLREMLS